MKTKHLLSFLFMSVVTATTYASPLFQAGSIEEGKKWPISDKTGIASYYEEGKTGMVQFSCDLEGVADNSEEKVAATLRTGKNFTNRYNMPITPLSEGMNGPFTWRLMGDAPTGNIKINYISGNNVTIQCFGKRI